MLFHRIDKIEMEIFQSVSDWEKLNMIMFESFNERFKYPIITNDFKRIKAYFRILRDRYYFAEYIYSLEILMHKIEKLNDDLLENNLFEEYDKYLFDFESIKNKELINEYLIKFIVRYNDICIKKHFTEIVEYQKKLNLEYFKIYTPKSKERLKILNKNLDSINNEIEFGTGKNILFGNFDLHRFSYRICLLTLEQKKDIFQKEIKLIQSKLKVKASPEIIDLVLNKNIETKNNIDVKIPYLYDGININTIPKSIYDELISNSNDRSFKSYSNDKGERITEFGEFNPPMFIYFDKPYNFHINIKHYDYLENKLMVGICFDENYNKVTKENIYSFYKYYNDGFLKGYKEFENSLKQNSSLFNITNDQIAYKIYSRIVRDGFLKKDGFMKLGSLISPCTEIETKISSENNIKSILKITEERFFESGFEGGEFYKAWEIILNNPSVFEPIFLKNSNTEKENEAKVINDTSIKEEYLGQPTNDNANDFFDFLIEYYRPEDKTQIKYVNILHYLKNDADKKHFIFKVKQDEFRTLVKVKTGIKISKFDKSAKYIEEEKPIFHKLENTFFKKMKV
ncbi:hypothetical protein [Flavobacterium sp. 83]|uniref:hypothetical protein n=1 Tax=Flavobacterium sp. 83 TaxID=1131812 RepID=UPI0012695D9F|nr:hypothetical protein [Flavobacterium sp. 83]